MKKAIWISAISAALISCAFADLASDNAADAAYNDGWQDGDNGGSGFGGWVFGADAAGRSGVQSSTVNGGLSSIDSGGRSFYLSDSDNSGSYIDVFRFLNTDLQVGETFALDMDVNWRSGYKGIRVRGTDDSSAIFRFEVGDPGGGDDYVVYDAATGNGSIGNAYSDDTQFRIELEQTSAGGGTWSIARSGGVSDFDSGTYSGSVSSFQLYSTGAGDSIYQAVYYNNLSVVPEPATLGLVGLAGAAMLALRRKFML
jgi:hypothetical protein